MFNFFFAPIREMGRGCLFGAGCLIGIIAVLILLGLFFGLIGDLVISPNALGPVAF